VIDYGSEVARLRALCAGAELWMDPGPLVYLPGLNVESGGRLHTVDAILSPQDRDGYPNKLYVSIQLPVARNWSTYQIKTKAWRSFSWRGVTGETWMDILAGHLEAAK